SDPDRTDSSGLPTSQELRANSAIFLPLEGAPASLGLGLRTASGANPRPREKLPSRAILCHARNPSQVGVPAPHVVSASWDRANKRFVGAGKARLRPDRARSSAATILRFSQWWFRPFAGKRKS